MSLNLDSVLKQAGQLSQMLADRETRVRETVPRASAEFKDASETDLGKVLDHIHSAGPRWSGAIPTEEKMGWVGLPPPHPVRYNVIAADGSQIYPDRHNAVYYSLINIGSILIQHGFQSTPRTHQEPRLLIDIDPTESGGDADMSAQWINGHRDVSEMQALANWAEQCQDDDSLALLDNSLLLWIALRIQTNSSPLIENLLDEYVSALDQLRACKCAIAGVIDRPRSRNVITLLQLINDLAVAENPGSADPLDLRDMTDFDLFEAYLPPGYRSARFIIATPLNARFENAGHQVQAFYLNPGQRGRLLRVEIPVWVAEDPGMLDLVHAGILEQCRSTYGFPYALVRAHELAVITQKDHQVMNGILVQLLAQHGVQAQPSAKSMTKQWTGGKKRHRL